MTTTPFTNREGMPRRRMLKAALAAGTAVPMGVARPAWAAPAGAGPVRLTLPAPTGPYPVGTVPLHLVDTSRPDPVAGPGHHRELKAAVWYPARGVERYPLARWTSPAVARALLASAGFPADIAMAPLTAGHEGAPVLRTGRRLPVVVLSHGAHDHRGGRPCRPGEREGAHGALCRGYPPVVGFVDAPPVPGRPVAGLVKPPGWAGCPSAVAPGVPQVPEPSTPLAQADPGGSAQEELAQVR
ncbi:hypothetical protein [Streptomyces sp. NPDC001480]|uniref:hypothetical protein n=1 Tax=Streptomyces sp. NPDC001480 TaxID=3364577 RepID=UPI0036A5B900